MARRSASAASVSGRCVSSERLAWIVRGAARRPAPVLAVVAVLALAGALLALRLHTSAGTDTLVGKGSASYRATRDFHTKFGDDAVVVMVRGPLPKLVLTSDIARLLGLEGCLSGNVPAGKEPPGGIGSPCGQLAQAKAAQVVYGPGTFINEAVGQVNDQAQKLTSAAAAQAKQADLAARKLAAAQGKTPAQQRQLGQQAQKLVEAETYRSLLQLALRYGVTPPFQLDNPRFVSSIVFDATRGAAVPKARFAYLFPNAALVQVRLRPDLTDAQRSRAIDLIREATRMPQWQLKNGGTYAVTGAPAVVDDLQSSLTHAIVVLLIAALLVMAATLALVFRARMRLLPLALALAAAALTFGAMSLAGAALTMASIAVLPVLIGLAVDYAIQFQSRVEEERRGGTVPVAEAAVRAARVGAPTIATAGMATIVGFLVLLLSPVPMVREFGVLLVVGIVLAFACALTAGTAALVLAGDRPRAVPGPLRRAGEGLAAAARGAGDLVGAAVGRLPRPRLPGGLDARGLLAGVTRHPRRCCGSASRRRRSGGSPTRAPPWTPTSSASSPATCPRSGRRTSSSGGPASPARSTSPSRPTTSPTRASWPG